MQTSSNRRPGGRMSALAKLGAAGLVTFFLAGTFGCQEEIRAGPTKANFAAERSRLAREAQQTPARVPAAEKDESAVSDSELARGFVYRPEGRRDPFRSMLFELQAAKDKRARAPLEQFELGQISLTGVIWEAEEPRALVTDPEGRSFVIKVGSRIGKNEGRVVRIGDNLVRVKETYVNFAGEETGKDVELRIRRSQGG